ALGELGENPTQEQMDEQVEKLRKYGKNFFKNYSAAIDEEITARMLKATSEALPADQQPQTVMRIVKERYQGDFAAFAKDLFANSHFTDESRFNAWLDNFSIQMAVADPAYALMSDVFNVYFNNQPQFVAMNEQIDELNRIYMKAQREVFAEKTFYPDANFTLRLTYGKAEGMKPNDGVRYKFYTTLDGVVAKYKPGDSEFDLPKKLLDLHAAKDYGKYGKDGELRVCFIASNHTSGGNSGSPLLNGDGHLVGLNFDRNWEGTMSDVNYDVNQCRNISVDIRYVLFIIDKLAGASHLIDEMKLIDES
ncbi:MAG: S46 family peptidase, partial [Bacteroidota bacterium]